MLLFGCSGVLGDICDTPMQVFCGYYGSAIPFLQWSRWLPVCSGWLPGCCYVVACVF